MTVDASWALGIIAGTIGTLVAVAIIALLARRRHHRPLQYEGKYVYFTISPMLSTFFNRLFFC